MATVFRGLRSRILTPSSSEVGLQKRGFHVKSLDAQELLETVGRTFLTGYAQAAAARFPSDVDETLGKLPVHFRGFAYEGAAMGFAVVDALSARRGWRYPAFLAGSGNDHIYMAYVGLGWALARVPRLRWPDLALDPVLQWLVLDGYGFHQAYFHTDRYVRQRYAADAPRWPRGGPDGYAARAVDQGIGRALWFVGGTDTDVVADLIESFPVRRRPDLYSGAGLAATYAGGAGGPELKRFLMRAGEHRPWVAQGSVFAAEARRRSGLEVPQTAIATQVFCGMGAEEAANLALRTRPEAEPGAAGGPPAYEVWRRRIAGEFASLERCQP